MLAEIAELPQAQTNLHFQPEFVTTNVSDIDGSIQTLTYLPQERVLT